MSKHTPGPWHLATAITQEDTAGSVAVVKRSIFAVFAPAARGEPDADARLVAAAPELLGALRCVVQNLETKRLNDGDRLALELARAAVAKAVTP